MTDLETVDALLDGREDDHRYGGFGFEDMTEHDPYTYMNEFLEGVGYENPLIMIQNMGDPRIGGATHTDVLTDDDGYITLNGDVFVFNGLLLPEDARPDDGYPEIGDENLEQFWYETGLTPLESLGHEATHGLQFREVRNSDYDWTADEFEQALLLFEGQAAGNNDDVTYDAARDVKQDVDTLIYEHDVDPATALQAVSDRYHMERVAVEGMDGETGYEFIAIDTYELVEEAGIATDDELEDAVDRAVARKYAELERHGYRIDEDETVEVDYSDPLYAEELGRLFVAVQDREIEGYTERLEEFGVEHVPRGFGNIEDYVPRGEDHRYTGDLPAPYAERVEPPVEELETVEPEYALA